MRAAIPDWVTPVGQRVTFACHCDDAEELDATYARVTAAGYIGRKAPWDTTWGQRYAFLQDPTVIGWIFSPSFDELTAHWSGDGS